MEPLPRSFPIKAFKYLNGHANEFFWGKPSRKFHFLAVRIAFIADFKKKNRVLFLENFRQSIIFIYLFYCAHEIRLAFVSCCSLRGRAAMGLFRTLPN